MSALKTRTLMRPAAQNLSLSLVEHPSLQFRTFSAYEPSLFSGDDGSMALPSMQARLGHVSTLLGTAGKSSRRTLSSALSTGSAYSQESFTYQTTPISADTRRFAIALESPNIDTIWPFATSPLSASTGAFILKLQKGHETCETSLPLVAFAATNVPHVVTSSRSLDAAIAILDAYFQSAAGEQGSPGLQLSDELAVNHAALESKGANPSSISASTEDDAVEPRKGGLPSSRGLGRLLSRASTPALSLKYAEVINRHTSAVAISDVQDGLAANPSSTMVPGRAIVVKRPKILRKIVPSTPRKQTFRRQRTSPPVHGSLLVSAQECPIRPLPMIAVSPLAVDFEGAKDDTADNGSLTPALYSDWETIGIAL